MGSASKLLSSLLLTSSPLRLRPSAAAFALILSSRTAASRQQHLPSSPSPLRTLSTSGAAAASPLPYSSSSSSASSTPPLHAPFPEWSRLVDRLAAAGYAARAPSPADELAVASGSGLSAEAESAVSSCLAFARDRPDLLRSLPTKDVEVVVSNVAPALFKGGEESAQRLQQYLAGEEDNAIQSVRAVTVDIVRYLLSYTYSSSNNYLEDKELTDSAVRNILAELVNSSGLPHTSSFVESTVESQPERFSRHPGQNVEMKRGDWICTRCSFMNFARNARCLECNEHRPKKMLTGREWECPQCEFYNYGRNMSCLRCACKRPATTASAGAGLGGVAELLNVTNAGRSEIERKLAQSDEKAERWLSKVSQLDDSADLSSLAADEDFPEIMPMRKGVNKFVVSTRKTPLERRLASAQYSSNNSPQATASDSKISQTLDRILGRSASTSAPNNQSDNGGVTAETPRKLTGHLGDIDPVPFVPLSADLFTKPQNAKTNEQADRDSQINKETGSSAPDITQASTERRDVDKSLDTAEKWSKKVAELDSVNDLSSAISDEDFPDIMPMRKGENRFVISKKKDRLLTSPQYQRRSVLEQADNSDFVPFVPFPPDYFAKKDAPAESTPDTGIVSESSPSTDKLPETNASSRHSGNSQNTSQVIGPQGSSIMNNENSNRNYSQQSSSPGGYTRGGSSSQQYQQQPYGVGDRSAGTPNSGAWNPNYSQGTSTDVRGGSSNYQHQQQPHEVGDRSRGTSNTGALNTNYSPGRFNDGRGGASNYQHQQQPHEAGGRSSGTSNTGAWNTNYSQSQGSFNDGRGGSNNYQHKQQPREVDDRSSGTSNTGSWNTNYSQSQGSFNDGRGGSNNYQHQQQPREVGDRSSGTSNTGSWNTNYSQSQGRFSDGRGGSSSYQYQTQPHQAGGQSSGSSNTLNTNYSQGSFNEGRDTSTYNQGSYSAQPSYSPGYSNHSNSNSWSSNNNQNWSGSHPDSRVSTTGIDSTNPNQGTGYSSYGGGGYTGKSLEGSAVKDPDPLDMSEEAKAERWFRRAAQIKDISELANIPDEDFPEIMPMRKGVNRFVVSKRKTPLERRLTSPQYRRNLPIVSSEPDKDGS
ncbi:zinc finger protein VAR3, chloroplastic-like [Triticum dicoccoides]|uniref:zinc finger protein VAR3, chloroplastic-like n=1 Tax=Triticum dicoccoides TaxID=85692 RepID=UPI00188E6B05|nr:zinc finger protein VAR3, chloroplastic-like [Triticum dicoccoides]